MPIDHIPPFPTTSRRIEVVNYGEQTRVLVDGQDITGWIAADGFLGVEVGIHGQPTLTVKLTGSEFSYREER